MKDITIVMPFLNEQEEAQNTIDSIYETADTKNFEIIAIDDCSKTPSIIKERQEVKVVRNSTRIGVDASRQLGIDLAQTPLICIFDAHMRFLPGWLDSLINVVVKEPQTLWCTQCLGLGYGNMDIHLSRDKYYGADFLFVNPDVEPNRFATEVLEPKWRVERDTGQYEIPCILGANYAAYKSWFNYIHGLNGLKMWGASEFFLSLKTWMAGGKCKINADVKIGHKFRDNAPYATGVWYMIYNKLYLIETLFEDSLKQKMINYFPKDTSFKLAMEEIKKNRQIIERERNYFKSICKMSIQDICNKFSIQLPH